MFAIFEIQHDEFIGNFDFFEIPLHDRGSALGGSIEF
jgi:hypothetical protein